MSPSDYRKLESLTVADIDLLKQAYQRLHAEGYEVGWSFADFLDITLGRGEHQLNQFYEMDQAKKLSKLESDIAVIESFNPGKSITVTFK